MGLGLMGKLCRAWIGARVGAWVGGGDVLGLFVNITHAPTHARPSLPFHPNPILTPAEEYGIGIHDTAAIKTTVFTLRNSV